MQSPSTATFSASMRDPSSAPEIAGSSSASWSGGGSTCVSSIARVTGLCTLSCALLTDPSARSYGPGDSHGYHTTWAMRQQETARVRVLKLSDQVTRELARRIANGEIGDEVPLPTEMEIC